MNLKALIASALVAGALLASPAIARSPDNLIYLTDPDGMDLFIQSGDYDQYFKLASYLEAEEILTFCGPATIAAVMNSLDVERPIPIQFHPWPLFTQDSVFTPENQALKPFPMVEHEGLTLEELTGFFQNLSVSATYTHADAFDAEGLRDIVREVMAAPDTRLVVNYSRRPIGQTGDGHISPVAAYDEISDRVLVLDVARYKYPPVWITIADMHAAMLTVDSSSEKMRGIVVVQAQ